MLAGWVVEVACDESSYKQNIESDFEGGSNERSEVGR